MKSQAIQDRVNTFSKAFNLFVLKKILDSEIFHNQQICNILNVSSFSKNNLRTCLFIAGCFPGFHHVYVKYLLTT